MDRRSPHLQCVTICIIANCTIGKIYLRILEDKRLQIYFQQNGVPAHHYVGIAVFLYNHFYNSWVVNDGSNQCPARSPDFTLMDFFQWGYIKDHKRGHFMNAIRIIRQKQIRNLLLSLGKKYKQCI